MAATIKPSGITLVRDGGLKFVINWKIADKDYGAGHQLRYRTWTSEKKCSNWTEIAMGANVTTKTITLSASNWFPTAKKPCLYYFEVEIRGKRANHTEKNVTVTHDWSAWAGKKWKMSVPNRPRIETELLETNSAKFSWDTDADAKDAKPLSDIEYQTIIKKACKEKDGSKLPWSTSNPEWATGTGNSSGSITKTEDTTRLASDSYTRWVRMRARGPRGCSDWRYAKHVYARPYQAKITRTKATEASGKTSVYVKWTAASDAAHPIDQTVVEYYIGTPGAGMTFPSGASPEEAVTSKDTSGADAATFVIDGIVDLDQCLFVRVNTKHDSNITTGEWKIVKKEKLAAPSGLTVSFDSGTNRVSVSGVTNNSDVPDAQLALVYKGTGSRMVVAVFSSMLPSNVQCPAETSSPMFGVYAFQGTATAKADKGSVRTYSVTANMKSETFTLGGNIPAAPENVTAEPSGREGEALLTWDWSWADANRAEISWSTNEYAWESTEEPSTYIVDSVHAAQWRVSGLEPGNIYYFRIRLLQVTDETTVYGDYSETKEVNLTTSPEAPVLSLSAAVLTEGEELTASWGYVTTDGTEQATADICEYSISYDLTEDSSIVQGKTYYELDDDDYPVFVPVGSPVAADLDEYYERTETYGEVVGQAQTAQHAAINTEGWTAGETHYLCVRATSESGAVSPWSDPVPVYVAEPISISISATNLVTEAIGDRSVLSLKEMPLTATITGAGAGGTTTLIVERLHDYHMLRPDDSVKDGFEGETICFHRQLGEDEISIAQPQYGVFDDGASYRLIAMVEDGYGQSATDELEFEVHWTDQAIEPTATVETEGDVAVIKAIAGTNTPAGSKCDIYRLSYDKPQLIVQNGDFGTDYVDPYPALGENAGYRCVCITENGDYITAGNKPAWVDVPVMIDEQGIVVDFNGKRVVLPYDISLSNRWTKDFKLTQYLGGSQRGDWNPAVKRTGTFNVSLWADDEEAELMRDLAVWTGICHVRTPEGSAFTADVQVSESKSMQKWNVVSFTLTITEVDPEVLDGIPYSEWIEQ